MHRMIAPRAKITIAAADVTEMKRAEVCTLLPDPSRVCFVSGQGGRRSVVVEGGVASSVLLVESST